MQRPFARSVAAAFALAACMSLNSAARASGASKATPAPTSSAREFTPLVRLPAPRIADHSPNYSGGHYNVENIFDGIADGSPDSEYSSNGQGVGTFIDFDFGNAVLIAGFEHIDRRDVATVDAAELLFDDAPDFKSPLARVPVDHVNKPGGKTLVSFTPIKARYVRWDVTAIKQHGTVGGAEFAFYAAGKPETEPGRIQVTLEAAPALLRRNGELVQPLHVTLDYPYMEPVDVELRLGATARHNVELRLGSQTLELKLPRKGPAQGDPEPRSIGKMQVLPLALQLGGQTLYRKDVRLPPVRCWTIYLMHHTHLDIGFTHTQEDVKKLQMQHIDRALELIRQSDDYPKGSQFKWLPEGLWAVESYLRQADAAKRTAFIEAVKKGRIGLDALYGNALTGLYNDEEMFALTDYAVRLRQKYGIKIDSAMISDVPGWSWGLIPALAHSGVKYLSTGPNPFHRRGWIKVWNDKPFWWVSPSGRHKVLCWQMGHDGYAWFHNWRHPDNLLKNKLTERRIFWYLGKLEKQGFPYNIMQLRYNIGADNGPPDPYLSDSVRSWNEKHAYPKIVIATTSELFHEMDRRYGDRIPRFRGDLTPYWEDGAASTAADTSVCRHATETLIQAEALWAMLRPGAYPDTRFYASWRDAVLYDEHTWGAHNAISEPDSAFARAQAARKQRFALDAASAASGLLGEATASRRAASGKVRAVEVFNTLSWPRTDLVVLPARMDLAGDAVATVDGKLVPSQRLSTGELALVIRDVPPLGSKKLLIREGRGPAGGGARATATSLSNGILHVAVDPKTGVVSELRASGIEGNLAGRAGLNEYIYVEGRKPDNQKRVGATTTKVLDAGPLVATVRVESEAPGARKLVRDIRLIDGIDRVDVHNVIDKLPVRKKEGVHFGFDFNVPRATVRMDIPWAVIRPEQDQLDGACKQFFPVQRWTDVSGGGRGVTWATVDAPLVQMGAIRTDVRKPHVDPEGWLRHIKHSPTLFSYVMNNYWETNYKADQEGLTTFRYSLRPHARYDQTAAVRLGIERNRPLVVVPVDAGGPAALDPLLTLDNPGVIITSLKPARSGKALMIRLFAASGKPERVHLSWTGRRPKAMHAARPDESRGPRVEGPLDLPAYGIAFLRAEF